MLKHAVQIMRWQIQGHIGQPSVREIDVHTMYNQWATTPGRNLNYPKPKSITHLRTFSDNGVYVNVALQLFLVIEVFDQWCRVLIPYSYRRHPGLITCSGMAHPIHMWFESHGSYIVSNVGSQVFTPYIIVARIRTARIRTPDLCTTRPTFLASRPWL